VSPKIGNVQPFQSAVNESVARRNVLVGAIYAMWAAISAAVGLPTLGYLLLPPKLKPQQGWTEIGDVTRLSPGVPVEMMFRRNRTDGWKITSEKNTAWVVRLTGNTILAFGPQCTHLGCAYHWDETRNQFLCPCHNSLFSVDGKVISGPAPRPLDRYATRIQGTHLYVGLLQTGAGKHA